MDRQQRHRWIFTGINVIAIALMLYVSSRLTNPGPKQVSYSEFLTELRAGNLSDVQITEHGGHMFKFGAGANLDDIVRAVNQVGAAPSDLVSILQALKEAGALHAELVVI